MVGSLTQPPPRLTGWNKALEESTPSMNEFSTFIIKHLSDSQYSDISISGAQLIRHIYSSSLDIHILTIPSSTTDVFELLPMVININLNYA
ncbi:hypothetical protein V9T40_001390 [Parthenolecanium corni]|uniref:Uncharacterized protein n=1 Tax=Parthenolecanium corni TaxID=536013 RepID=A0AAN9TCR3_9HEMI